MSIEQNIRLIRRVIEAFNTGNTSNVPEVVMITLTENHKEQRTHTDLNLKDLTGL